MVNLLSDLIAKARAAGADAADALLVDGVSLSLAWRLGRLEKLERSESADIGLRVLIGRRQAMVSSSDRSPAALAELVERAVAMARVVPEDPYAGLADPSEIARDLPDLDTCDPFEPSAEGLLEMAGRAEDAARAVPGITNSEGAEIGWSRSRIALVGSNGVVKSHMVSGSSLSVAVLAGDGASGMERDYDYTSAVYLGDLRLPEHVGREAARRTVHRLGARKMPTVKVPVVFEPRVARGLLGSLAGAINGAAVARGTSFLKDSLGKRILPPGTQVVDDPRRLRGLRSYASDAEGVESRRRLMVEDGILASWFLDLRSARQLGMRSTGHGSRGPSSPPSPTPSNLYLEAGPVTADEMIGDIASGFYVTDLFGQGVNLVTGDYSRGAAGFWIENGEIAYPVNEVTVAGNLKDMLLNLTPASDLTLAHGIDSPSLRIDGMIVAGR